MRTRCLVTGHKGFIGSHLAERLIVEGYDVYGIDDMSGGQWGTVGVKEYICDLRDVEETSKIIDIIKPEIVYHLAANAAENLAQFSPIDITSRNWNTFINTLVPAIRNGMKRIVVTSSIAVYGALQTPFKETDTPEPEDLYGISKLMMEKSLKVLSEVHGFEYVVARPHNVYGERQNMSDPYRNVVTIFMNAILKGEPYYIYGDGEQRRCFSYIEDVVDSLYKCGFERGVEGLTFNIGADTDYSLNQLSEAILEASGSILEPIHIEDRPREVKVAIADHALAKKHLGYLDSVGLKEGILRTWEYAKKLGYQKPIYHDPELPSPKIPSNWGKK